LTTGTARTFHGRNSSRMTEAMDIPGLAARKSVVMSDPTRVPPTTEATRSCSRALLAALYRKYAMSSDQIALNMSPEVMARYRP